MKRILLLRRPTAGVSIGGRRDRRGERRAEGTPPDPERRRPDKRRAVRHYEALVEELLLKGVIPEPAGSPESRGNPRWSSGTRSRRCRASGWALHIACVDANSDVVCPLCDRRVQTRPNQVGRYPVRVITRHRQSHNPAPAAGPDGDPRGHYRKPGPPSARA